MRKLTFIILLIFCSMRILSAQYSVDKNKYDYHEYVYDSDDKYVPALAGVASYILPGLGHIYCNEPARGYKFMAAYGGAILVTVVGGVTSIYSHDLRKNNNSFGDVILIAGAVSGFGIQIWSCIDAVKVSKVNNMALRDKKKTSFNLKLTPYFNQSYNGGFDKGLTLCLQLNWSARPQPDG